MLGGNNDSKYLRNHFMEQPLWPIAQRMKYPAEGREL